MISLHDFNQLVHDACGAEKVALCRQFYRLCDAYECTGPLDTLLELGVTMMGTYRDPATFSSQIDAHLYQVTEDVFKQSFMEVREDLEVSKRIDLCLWLQELIELDDDEFIGDLLASDLEPEEVCCMLIERAGGYSRAELEEDILRVDDEFTRRLKLAFGDRELQPSLVEPAVIDATKVKLIIENVMRLSPITAEPLFAVMFLDKPAVLGLSIDYYVRAFLNEVDFEDLEKIGPREVAVQLLALAALSDKGMANPPSVAYALVEQLFGSLSRKTEISQEISLIERETFRAQA